VDAEGIGDVEAERVAADDAVRAHPPPEGAEAAARGARVWSCGTPLEGIGRMNRLSRRLGLGEGISPCCCGVGHGGGGAGVRHSVHRPGCGLPVFVSLEAWTEKWPQHAAGLKSGSGLTYTRCGLKIARDPLHQQILVHQFQPNTYGKSVSLDHGFQWYSSNFVFPFQKKKIIFVTL